MRSGSILKLVLFAAIIFMLVTVLVSVLVSAGNDEEEDWPYDTNDEQRYMELHLKTDGTVDYLTHKIWPGQETNYKSVGTTGVWSEFGEWDSQPLEKPITATREEEQDHYEPMYINVTAETPGGTPRLVFIRVTLHLGNGNTVQEVDGPRFVSQGQYTTFNFSLEFSSVNINQAQEIGVVVEARTEGVYNLLSMAYGSEEYDSFFNFEANTISLTVEKDVNGYIKNKKVNGIAYANVSFIHAFGNEGIDQDRNYYIRIYGPANKSDPASTEWGNTICWCDTLMYLLWEYDEDEGVLRGTWQIQGDKENKGVRAQYALDNRTYFIYFKGWDVYPENNNTPVELNATFKVPDFPAMKERVELRWAGDVFFSDENGKRFEATDENGKGIAVGDRLFINASFQLGGGADPDMNYNNIPICVSILKPDSSTEIFNNTYIVEGVQGGSYKSFGTSSCWVPDEAVENYTLRLELNPGRTIPEYNYTNNLLEMAVNVYEDRGPKAIITSPGESIEELPGTYLPAGANIHFDGTDSWDPNTTYVHLDFEWIIENLETKIGRNTDEFYLQLGVGRYKVTLTVSDGIRNDETTIFIIVENRSAFTRPTATILSIRPGSQVEGVLVRFTGSGEGDGAMVCYVWVSSLDGEFYNGSETVVNYSELSVGSHEITLTVQDEHGLWSEKVSATLDIKKGEGGGSSGNGNGGGGNGGDGMNDDDEERFPTGFEVVLLVLGVVIAIWLRGRRR